MSARSYSGNAFNRFGHKLHKDGRHCLCLRPAIPESTELDDCGQPFALHPSNPEPAYEICGHRALVYRDGLVDREASGLEFDESHQEGESHERD